MVYRSRSLVALVLLMAMGLFVLPVRAAEVSTPALAAGELSADAAIDVLRSSLVESFNKKDVEGVLRGLAPDAVVTWQDGTVCRGPAQVKAYYAEKMGGAKPVVSRITADPQVEGRQVYGDWAVSYGRMNDHFFFTDGSDLKMDSRFTATISKHGEKWLISSFHLSTNTFDNPVLGYAGAQGFKYGVAAGLIAGVLVGALVVFLCMRRGCAKTSK